MQFLREETSIKTDLSLYNFEDLPCARVSCAGMNTCMLLLRVGVEQQLPPMPSTGWASPRSYTSLVTRKSREAAPCNAFPRPECPWGCQQTGTPVYSLSWKDFYCCKFPRNLPQYKQTPVHSFRPYFERSNSKCFQRYFTTGNQLVFSSARGRLCQ